MDNIKTILENIKNNNFENIEKIMNLHIHTTASDGSLVPNDAINFARENGYKYFSITDHNTFNAYKEIDYNNIDGLITGIEFDCWYKGIFFHLLCYGINPDSVEMQSFLAKTKQGTEKDIVRIFANRDVKKIIKTVHKLGGIAVLAHPCCCWCFSLGKFYNDLKKLGLDGVEGYYLYKRHRAFVKFHDTKHALELAKSDDFLITAGTDKH